MRASALLLALLLAPAAQAQMVFKLGYSLPPTSHYGIGAQAFADDLKARSDGRLRLELFAANALGGEREMVEGVQIGTVDLVVTSTGPVGNFVPATLVTDIPFLFRDYAHARGVLDGPIGQAILDQFPSHGLIALAWCENGFRHLTNSVRPVRQPQDLKGLKLRTMQNEVHIAAFKALGALPTPMAFPELFTALQQHTVDGQENPLTPIISAKFAEVQKYLTLTGHVYSPALFLMSPAAWDDLPPADQALLVAAARVGARAMRDEVDRQEHEGVEILSRQGMEVTRTIDRAAFEQALAPAYASYARRFGADLLESIRAWQPGPPPAAQPGPQP